MTTEPNGGALQRSGSDFNDDEFRRNFLLLLAEDPHAVTGISEQAGVDRMEMIEAAVQAIARELVAVGCESVETRETVEGLKVAASLEGAMLGGLMGVSKLAFRDDEDEAMRELRTIAQADGAAIRGAAGLPMLEGASNGVTD